MYKDVSKSDHIFSKMLTNCHNNIPGTILKSTPRIV